MFHSAGQGLQSSWGKLGRLELYQSKHFYQQAQKTHQGSVQNALVLYPGLTHVGLLYVKIVWH